MKYKTPDEEERMTGVDLDKEEVQWVSCDCVTCDMPNVKNNSKPSKTRNWL